MTKWLACLLFDMLQHLTKGDLVEIMELSNNMMFLVSVSLVAARQLFFSIILFN